MRDDMQLPIHLHAASHESLQAQLFDQFVSRIIDGRLKPGTRMPATRQLASDLGISRNTVVLAYERLMAEGYIDMRRPQGTFVVEHGHGAPGVTKAKAKADPPRSDAAAADVQRAPMCFDGRMHHLRPPHGGALAFDFWVGRPDPRLFPAQAWRKLVEQSLSDIQHGDGSYGEPAGLDRLRAAVAKHVGAARGIVCGPEDVVITNGIQEGINISCRLLLAHDTTIAMECPGYLGAAHVFSSYGAGLLSVRVDDEGAVPDGLDGACRLAYLTPAHQYPSGVAMSPQRRQAWLRWARDCGGYLIEDDYDSDFYYDGAPQPAMKADDEHGCVIYLGTFSKSLSAGLRVGYMIVPPRLRDGATTAKGLMTNGSPWLVQASLAGFVDSGEYAHHLRRLRKQYAARRDILRASLARCFGTDESAGAQAGMHVLWQAPAHLPAAADIEHLARANGVGVYSLESCNVWSDRAAPHTNLRHALLLGYAALDETEITAGIERLAVALGVRGIHALPG